MVGKAKLIMYFSYLKCFYQRVVTILLVKIILFLNFLHSVTFFKAYAIG